MTTYKAIATCNNNNLIVAQSGKTEKEALEKLHKNFPGTIGNSYWIIDYEKDVQIHFEIQAEQLLKPKLPIDELEECQKENELNYYGGRA